MKFIIVNDKTQIKKDKEFSEQEFEYLNLRTSQVFFQYIEQHRALMNELFLRQQREQELQEQRWQRKKVLLKEWIPVILLTGLCCWTILLPALFRFFGE